MRIVTVSIYSRGTLISKRGVGRDLVSSLLWAELLVTIILDTANELLGLIGFPLILGQIVRAGFLIINLLVVLEYGERREAQSLILLISYFVLMILREVNLGVEAIAYAASYWAKFISYYSTFLAVKCAGFKGKINVDVLDKFFKWSIAFLAPAFIFLAALGLLQQSSFDSGFEGAILSKNSMSATLLIQFAMALYLMFRGRIFFIWPAVVAVSLFLLGSKSTIFFAAIMTCGCILHEVSRLSPKGFFVVGVLFCGIVAALWLFWDSVSSVLEAQLLRYRYVLTQQGGSLVDYVLTGRNDLLEAGFESYCNDMNALTILFGVGISSLGHCVANIVNASLPFRGIEMDLFEVAMASGFVGIVVVVAPYLVALKGLLDSKSREHFYLLLGLLVSFGFMVLGGHVVTEGMPASYLGVYLAYIVLETKRYKTSTEESLKEAFRYE